MTENEKNAREIVSGATKLNKPIGLLIDLYAALQGEPPILTDDECKSIASDTHYSWEDIRVCFEGGV